MAERRSGYNLPVGTRVAHGSARGVVVSNTTTGGSQTIQVRLESGYTAVYYGGAISDLRRI